MSDTREHLQTLTEIRSLMERSSKFLSLSSLSGVSAGLIALAGAGAAYARLHTDYFDGLANVPVLNGAGRRAELSFLLTDAVLVLLLALGCGIFFTVRRARQQGHTVWNPTSRRLLWAMAGPLVAGGLFCLGLIYHGLIWLTFPATLIFYGLALLSGSKYTVRDVAYLGVLEVALGLLALVLTGYSLLMWAIGFGVLHIVYGLLMYVKYERRAA